MPFRAWTDAVQRPAVDTRIQSAKPFRIRESSSPALGSQAVPGLVYVQDKSQARTPKLTRLILHLTQSIIQLTPLIIQWTQLIIQWMQLIIQWMQLYTFNQRQKVQINRKCRERIITTAVENGDRVTGER